MGLPILPVGAGAPLRQKRTMLYMALFTALSAGAGILISLLVGRRQTRRTGKDPWKRSTFRKTDNSHWTIDRAYRSDAYRHDQPMTEGALLFALPANGISSAGPSIGGTMALTMGARDDSPI